MKHPIINQKLLTTYINVAVITVLMKLALTPSYI